MPRKVEISHKTIIFTVLFLLSLFFLFIVREIILQLFVALLLMTIFEPLVSSLTKIKIPRVFAVLLTYVLIIAALGGTVALIIPTLVDQTTNFVNSLPIYLSNIGVSSQTSTLIITQILTQLGSFPGEVLQFTVSIFSNLIKVVTVLVFAFYMLLSRNKLEDQLGFFFGEERRRQIGVVIDQLDSKLGGWARGQLIIMFLIGLGTYIGLFLVGIPFALPLAILAGLLEIVPFLGPIVAAVPSIIIGFGISPVLGFGATAVAFLVHQLENYLLVPKIMEKSVGLSPIVILAALAIGVKLAGIMGILISVPFVITIKVLVSEYFAKRATS